MEKYSSYNLKSNLGILLLPVLCFFSLSSKVSAQNVTSLIQLEPAFQEIVLTESIATVSAQIKITNTTESVQEFDLSAIEIQQFDANGNVILNDKPQLKSDSPQSAFVTLPQKKVQVTPHDKVAIPVYITNNQSLSPGGHYIALVARLSGNSNDGKQVVLPAVSAFLLIRKTNGEVFNLSLIESNLKNSVWWQGVPPLSTLRFKNQGNTHVIPRGIVTVTDQFQRLVAKSTINENSLYIFPSTERDISQKNDIHSRPMPISLLKVQIKGTTQPGSIPFNESTFVLSIEPIDLGIYVVLITCVLLGIHKVFRRYQQINKK